MAEASERQAALPGRVGKPDGACLDEPIDRRRGSHDARIERSARFKCDPSLPEARAAVARDMDRRHAVQARFQIVGRTELDRRLDIPKLRLARRKKTVNGFGLDAPAPTFVAPPLAVGDSDRFVSNDSLGGEGPRGMGYADRTPPASSAEGRWGPEGYLTWKAA